MLAPVPPCAGECRFVRGDSVGNRAADPDLWGICGDADMQVKMALRFPNARKPQVLETWPRRGPVARAQRRDYAPFLDEVDHRP